MEKLGLRNGPTVRGNWSKIGLTSKQKQFNLGCYLVVADQLAIVSNGFIRNLLPPHGVRHTSRHVLHRSPGSRDSLGIFAQRKYGYNMRETIHSYYG